MQAFKIFTPKMIYPLFDEFYTKTIQAFLPHFPPLMANLSNKWMSCTFSVLDLTIAAVSYPKKNFSCYSKNVPTAVLTGLLLLSIIPSSSIHHLQNKHRPPPPVSDLEGWGPVNLLTQATGSCCWFPASLFRLFPWRRVTLLCHW